MSTIAVFGNHIVPYCTESELAWTLEDMGHQVLRWQENKITTEQMVFQAGETQIDLFIYIHTHGWTTPGQMSMDDCLRQLKMFGVKTCSFHLDLYWGLNKSDKREDRVGQHAFWHTDRVFTADGGHNAEFVSRGVRHYWLPPAVAKRHCFKGTASPKYTVDVAFVGSKGYHPEYPFRGQLIAALERIHGSRFKRFNGDAGGVVRERQLNDLYASVKVVVGDSCFAGIPHYWSDRVPETLGRGGFLIHPAVEGLAIPGLVTYEPQNLAELDCLVDYYLQHEDERQDMIDLAMVDVLHWHTYHNRMNELLTVMELN